MSGVGDGSRHAAKCNSSDTFHAAISMPLNAIWIVWNALCKFCDSVTAGLSRDLFAATCIKLR